MHAAFATSLSGSNHFAPLGCSLDRLRSSSQSSSATPSAIQSARSLMLGIENLNASRRNGKANTTIKPDKVPPTTPHSALFGVATVAARLRERERLERINDKLPRT